MITIQIITPHFLNVRFKIILQRTASRGLLPVGFATNISIYFILMLVPWYKCSSSRCVVCCV